MKQVTFVYLGDSLPGYAPSAISLCARYSGLTPHLLASASIEPVARKAGASFTALEEFYDPKVFRNHHNVISADPSFRNGFWFRTLERFFVLEQFMAASATEILHAELDQLLFRVDLLLQGVSKIATPGIYLPFHSPESALASVVYIREAKALASMLDWATRQGPFRNEMQLIARWAESSDSAVFCLPTLATHNQKQVLSSNSRAQIIDVGVAGGLLDAAQIGQWVGGIDPSNVPLPMKPRTKYCDPPAPHLLSRSELEALRFSLAPDEGLLVQIGHHAPIRIYNLHLHSKIHKWLQVPHVGVSRLISLANENNPHSFLYARKLQLQSQSRKRLGTFARRSLRFLKRRLSLVD